MSTTLTINGTGYSFPGVSDENWGQNVSDWAAAVSTHLLQKTGGAFTLTSEVDFGSSFGLKSQYYKSRATNPASSGQLRLGNTESVSWRNAANNADLALRANASDRLEFNSVQVATLSGTETLSNKTISGLSNTISDIGYSSLSLTGGIVNADVSSSAAIQYSKLNLSNSILNADINSSAAIAYSKLSLGNSIVNSDVSASAAIAYSKLNLSNSIVNADISSSAAIARSKVASGSLNHVVINDGTGAMASESQLAISRGGTGQGTASAAFDALSPATTKGDVIVRGTSSNVRLPVGADGQVLTADGAEASGIKWATPASAPSSAREFSNGSLACSVSSNALTISLKDSSGSDPSAGSSVRIGFRSATATSGAFNQRTITGALSVTVSSGSTLGHPSGRDYPIYVYAIDNAGTVELAVSSTWFNEGRVVSTTAEGGSGAADNESVMYSTTARSNVPCRLIGVLTSNQTTAGTWAAVPTVVSLYPQGPRTLRAADFATTRVTSTPTRLGEWRSLYIASASSFTLSDNAPTDTPSSANGFRIYGKPYNVAGTSGQEQVYYIYVGKNRNVTFQFYASAGRTGLIGTDFFIFGADSLQRGIRKGYDPSTGVAWFSTEPGSVSNTGNGVGVTDANSTAGNCYFDIIVSDDRIGQ